ncbi:MAG: molybdopterin molybdotransferase MoeA [Gammaproteobacteria bacterium]|nr:molybdopterin molybdotransferase MoeA [Gammaproteobacteria bacterium]
MISYQEALGIILAESAVRGRRSVPLHAAAGHISAEALHARLDVPAFANAAMDGYAVAAADTAKASEQQPLILPVAGSVAAGLAPFRATAGSTWEIMTGAPVPAGLDAVVPVERIAEHVPGGPAPTTIRLLQPAQPGQNVRQMSEDFRRGDLVVKAGTRLAPHHLMGLAACGLDEVSVCETPRVAILTTGSELASSGSTLRHGQIRDANGPYLHALLAHLGIAGGTHGTAADTVTALRDELAQLADGCELLLTTGGVSAGRLDLVPDVVRALGGEILFHKVAIRPGKPILYARLPGGKHLFGLPGNPLAVAVGMRFFVMPALRALQGMAQEVFTPAICDEAVRSRGKLRFFAKAHRTVDPEARSRVQILPGQESFRIGSLLKANCWAVIPEGNELLPAGSTVLTAPLYPDDAP